MNPQQQGSPTSATMEADSQVENPHRHERSASKNPPYIQLSSSDSPQYQECLPMPIATRTARSGFSQSLNISIDHRSGRSSPSPRQCPRSSISASGLRHRSPQPTSQERYMPYGATSPLSPLSPRNSTSPFLVHSPPHMAPNPSSTSSSSSSSSNFLSATVRSDSPTYAHHSLPPLRSSTLSEPGPIRSPPHPSTSPSSLAQHQQIEDYTGASVGHGGRHLESQVPNYAESETLQDRSFPSSASPVSPPSYPYPSYPPFSLQGPGQHPSTTQHRRLSGQPIASSHPSRTVPGLESRQRISREQVEPMGSYRTEEDVHRQHHYYQQQYPAQYSRSQDQVPTTAYSTSPYYGSASGSSSHDQGSFHEHYPPLPPQRTLQRSSHYGPQQQQQQHPMHPQNMPTRHYTMPSEHSQGLHPLSTSSSRGGPNTTIGVRSGLPFGIARTASSSSSSSVTGILGSGPAGAAMGAGLSAGAVPMSASSSMTAPSSSSSTATVTGATPGGGEPLRTTRRRRRPNESYSNIIIKAIRNSPLQRLKLSEIYEYVSREIPHMNGNDKGWQNTVRHNLSHNKCFQRIVIKDMGPFPSGSGEEDEDAAASSGKGSSSKHQQQQQQQQQQGKKGKGGYWVLVPEKLEESMSSSRPKKSSVDQGRQALSPKRQQGQPSEPRSLNMMQPSGSTSSQYLSQQHSHQPLFQQHSQQPQPQYFQRGRPEYGGSSQSSPSSSSAWQHQQGPRDRRLQGDPSLVMDIDREVASMAIAENSPHYAPQYSQQTQSQLQDLHQQQAPYQQGQVMEHYSFAYTPTSFSASGSNVFGHSSGSESHTYHPTSTESSSHLGLYNDDAHSYHPRKESEHDNDMESESDGGGGQSGRSGKSSPRTGSDFEDLDEGEASSPVSVGLNRGDDDEGVMDTDEHLSGQLSEEQVQLQQDDHPQDKSDNEDEDEAENKMSTVDNNNGNMLTVPSSPSSSTSGRGRGMSIQNMLN